MKAIFLLFFCVRAFAYTEFFDDYNTKIKWQALIDIKKYNENFIPQGVTVIDENTIAVSVHENDKHSFLMFFDIQKENINLKYKLKLADDATHTSDLEFYEGKLYALDYSSNKIYIYDIDNEKIKLIKEIQTNLSSSGSACITNINGTKYYAITRFLKDSSIYFIPLKNIYEKDSLDKNDIAFKTKASHFIQGLYCYDNKVLVSANTAGTDVIYLYELKDKKLNLLNSYNAPTTKVEDIVVFKQKLITSGEESNENIFYISEKIDEI